MSPAQRTQSHDFVISILKMNLVIETFIKIVNSRSYSPMPERDPDSFDIVDSVLC